MSSAWNRQKVSSLYSLAHSKDKLPWMSPEIVGIIDTANQYQTETNSDSSPNELVLMIITLHSKTLIFRQSLKVQQQGLIPGAINTVKSAVQAYSPTESTTIGD